MKRKNNKDWFWFFADIMGYNFYHNKKMVPKYILYYKGFTANQLLLGRTKYKAIKNQN